MPTPHNSAVKGEIADIVLMPGDPMRAKYIADNFLENAKCFNEVRAMYGFTGMYKGKKISVMGSGMGTASMGIYAYELYKFYDVKKIIRIGSCGAYNENFELLDTFIVEDAYSESNFALTFRNSKEHTISASKDLTEKMKNVAKENNIKVFSGTALTSEAFDKYIDVDKLLKRVPKGIKPQVAEMEAFALFNIAEELKKEAACVLTVVDTISNQKSVSAKKRELALNDMIRLALETAIKE